MTRGLNEEQTAVHAGILNVTFALRSKLLPQVGRVLVLDVFDNWVPANVHWRQLMINSLTTQLTIYHC